MNIDSTNVLPEENKICPKCGSNLVLRNTKHGQFLGCNNYPICDYIEKYENISVNVIKVMENSQCPSCGSKLAVKKSRYGMFIGCLNYPNCNYVFSDNNENTIICPQCKKGILKQHSNKYGKSFYSCSNFKFCKYLVLFQPIEKTCENCGSQILLVRKNKNGKYLQCPNKNCKHKFKYDYDIDEN